MESSDVPGRQLAWLARGFALICADCKLLKSLAEEAVICEPFSAENSLLTGNNTGNFMNSASRFRPLFAVNASFWISSGPKRPFWPYI